MTPHSLIDSLDRHLAASGEDTRLVRVWLGPNGVTITFSARCRAFVRGFTPAQLVNGITQQDVQIILSPTDLTRARWPGGTPAQAGTDKRVPRINSDRIITSRGTLTFQAASGRYVDNELVRIDGMARGSG